MSVARRGTVYHDDRWLDRGDPPPWPAPNPATQPHMFESEHGWTIVYPYKPCGFWSQFRYAAEQLVEDLHTYHEDDMWKETCKDAGQRG